MLNYMQHVKNQWTNNNNHTHFLFDIVNKFHKAQNRTFTLREQTLHRRETTQFLREMDDCLDALPISCVFLKKTTNNDSQSLDDYELHIKITLNSFTQSFITQLAKKHNLLLKVSNGFLVIYSPESRLLEIAA